MHSESSASGNLSRMVVPDELDGAKVIKFADEGFYLFYLDGESNVVTDTYHDSVEAALARAAFEYRGLAWNDSDSA